MEAAYDIKLDRGAKLIRVRVCGVWTMEILIRYNPELHRTMHELAATYPTGSIAMLVDMRDYGVQVKEVAEAVQASIMSNGIDRLSVALVTSVSALQTMQAKRVTAVGSGIAFFTAEKDALEWVQQQLGE